MARSQSQVISIHLWFLYHLAKNLPISSLFSNLRKPLLCAKIIKDKIKAMEHQPLAIRVRSQTSQENVTNSVVLAPTMGNIEMSAGSQATSTGPKAEPPSSPLPDSVRSFSSASPGALTPMKHSDVTNRDFGHGALEIRLKVGAVAVCWACGMEGHDMMDCENRCGNCEDTGHDSVTCKYRTLPHGETGKPVLDSELGVLLAATTKDKLDDNAVDRINEGGGGAEKKGSKKAEFWKEMNIPKGVRAEEIDIPRGPRVTKDMMQYNLGDGRREYRTRSCSPHRYGDRAYGKENNSPRLYRERGYEMDYSPRRHLNE
jgi:hypothetical protein